MIAVDTNLLVYAHREDSPWHRAAAATMSGLAEEAGAWAIPWPCVHEFLAIVTHRGIYRPPTPRAQAIDQVEAWMESPRLSLLGESKGCWDELKRQLDRGRVAGARVHDARIAALCVFQGVNELWTADRDFGRFPGVKSRNPLLEAR